MDNKSGNESLENLKTVISVPNQMINKALVSKFILILLKFSGCVQGYYQKMYSRSKSGIDIVEMTQKRVANLSHIDGYMLCEELEALKSILSPKIQNTTQMLEYFDCNNRFTTFQN